MKIGLGTSSKKRKKKEKEKKKSPQNVGDDNGTHTLVVDSAFSCGNRPGILSSWLCSARHFLLYDISHPGILVGGERG